MRLIIFEVGLRGCQSFGNGLGEVKKVAELGRMEKHEHMPGDKIQ